MVARAKVTNAFVVTQKFQKISKFIVFRFLKNHEISVLGTKIIPTTFELNLTGSLYYGSAVSNLALFPFQKISIFQKSRLVEGSKYRY